MITALLSVVKLPAQHKMAISECGAKESDISSSSWSESVKPNWAKRRVSLKFPGDRQSW